MYSQSSIALIHCVLIVSNFNAPFSTTSISKDGSLCQAREFRVRELNTGALASEASDELYTRPPALLEAKNILSVNKNEIHRSKHAKQNWNRH